SPETLVAPLLARALSRNRECLRRPPCDADLIAHRGRGAALAGVLAAHDQLAAGLQRDDVAGEDADVNDVRDFAGFHVRAWWRLVVLGEEGDLLRPDGDLAAVALDEVGDADEAGHERRPRVLVHLGGGAGLLDAAIAHDRDAV